MKILVLGVGMGPQHLTPEVSDALHATDYIVAARKGDEDGLLAIRKIIADSFGLEIIEINDPNGPGSLRSTTRPPSPAWVSAYETVLRERAGTAAFLVWGDPSLYDSTIRVVAQLASLLPAAYDVLPGISAPQVLAARHRIVLHEVGEPVHVTTARRLPEALAAGQSNIVVLLTADLSSSLTGLDDWSIWWGANLGTPSEELAAGRVGDVRASLVAARARAKAAAGWVMDVYLLRGPAPVADQ